MQRPTASGAFESSARRVHTPIKYATVCSGIEAMSMAVEPLKWEPLWFSEINPFANAVLAHYHPHVPNLGDMLNIRGKDYEGKIDVLAGGTPCQSFSNAGRKRGLADPRGRLSPAFAKLALGARPEWIVWENVRGALSNDGGRAFASILSAFTGREVDVPPDGWKGAGVCPGSKGFYSVAWRLLDSQFTRVAGYERALAQQRLRLWLVGYAGDWAAPAEILIGAVCEPPVPCPLRLQTNPDRAADAGSAGNPISIAGNIIGRDPKNQFIHRQKGWRTGASYTLTAKQRDCVLAGDGVRKLTPLEYERLMGFPDGYTGITVKGKKAGDYARCFALGNSWPVNCARFVCERIDKYVKGELL